jgi:hypothetical protein
MQLTTSPSQHTTVPLCRTFPACNTYAVSLVDRGVRIKRLGRDSFGCVQRLVRARARSLVVRSMPAGILRRSGYRHRPMLQRGCTSAMRSRATGKRAPSQSSQASASAGTVAAATSAPGLGPLVPHLCRDWGHSCHICAGTGATRATSAPGLGPLAQLASCLQRRPLRRSLVSCRAPCARTHRFALVAVPSQRGSVSAFQRALRSSAEGVSAAPTVGS